MSTQLVRQPVTPLVSHDPVTVGDLLARSGFFTDAREAAQAAVKVMAGAELGFGPIASMTGVYIVKGKVTLGANLMAAAIKRHPAYTYRIKQHTTEVCEIDFLEDGEVVGSSTFTMDDARKAGLAGSQTWKAHPRNMLFARAMSNGAKWHCPDVFGGATVYTPEELGAEVDGETGDPVHQPAPQPEKVEVLDPDPNADLLSESARGLPWKTIREVITSVGLEPPEHADPSWEFVPEETVDDLAAALLAQERAS